MINREQLGEINALVKMVSQIDTLLHSESLEIVGSSKNHEDQWRNDGNCDFPKEIIKPFLTNYRDLCIKHLAELGYEEGEKK